MPGDDALRNAVRELVATQGAHPGSLLGIDLASEVGPERWLVAALLFSRRAGEDRVKSAFAALERAGRCEPPVLAEADPGALAALLERAGHPEPEATAARLVRSAAALAREHGGSVATLCAGADDLEDLGARLLALAPGLGPATALRFLRPLRWRVDAAREVPLEPAARVAAVHLGLLAEGEDAEGEPGALRDALLRLDAGPDPADVEAALARLGRRACLRERAARCPLPRHCPVR